MLNLALVPTAVTMMFHRRSTCTTLGQASEIVKICSHQSCTKRPTLNFEGVRKAAYCKLHSEGRTSVPGAACRRHAQIPVLQCCRQQASRTKIPYFNVAGSKTALYCKKHAVDGMADVRSKRCLHGCCSTRPTYNFNGKGSAACCKQHAADGMVYVG